MRLVVDAAASGAVAISAYLAVVSRFTLRLALFKWLSLRRSAIFGRPV